MPKDKRTRFIDIRQTGFGVASAAGGTTGGEDAPDATPPLAPPSEPPANLVLTTALVNVDCIPVSTITASWDAPAGRDPALYLVQYAHTSAFLVPDTQEVVSADVETTIGFLDASTTYYVRVAAITGGIRSAWCTPASITTDSTDAAFGASTLILRPTKAGGSGNDGVWAYDVDATTWTLYGEGLLPSGWRWGTIVVNPTNQIEWVMFGVPNNAYGATFDQIFMGSDPSISIASGAVVARGTSISPVWRTTDAGATWAPVSLTSSQGDIWIDCFYIAFDSLGAFHAAGIQRNTSGSAGIITRWRGNAGSPIAGTDLTAFSGPGVHPNNANIFGMTTGQAGETYISFFHYDYLDITGTLYPIGKVTTGGALSILSTLPSTFSRQMARQYGSDHVAGIEEDPDFIIYGLVDVSDITSGSMTRYTDVDVDHKPCLIFADGTVITSDGAVNPVLTGWTIGVSQATVFGPLSGVSFGVGVADVLDGTQAAVNVASTTASAGKDVVYFNASTWTHITGPSASSHTTIANSIALVRISGDDCAHGCPPNTHHANHEIGGCDPLLLQLIDGEITTSQIADDAVTAAKIAAGAVGSSELASTAVTPGSYTNTDLTVDADGRITAAASGSVQDHNHTGSSDGGKLTNDDHDGYSLYEEISAPSSPAANTARLYARDKSGVTELFYKNDAGTERDLSAGGLTIEEVDASPTGSATKLILPNGTLSYSGSEATYTPASSGAPTGATYITQTHDATLSAEQALGDLATGILKNTTTTGVLSIATGSDLPSHTHTHSDVSDFNEAVDDEVNALIVAGTGISTSYNDGANTYTITAVGGGTGQNIYNPDYPPASANSDDDEFSDSSLAGAWTTWDPGSKNTVTEVAHGLNFSYASANAYNIAGIHKTLASGDFSVMTKVSVLVSPANYFFAGLLMGQDLISNPNTSDVVAFGLYRGATAGFIIQADRWTQYNGSPTTVVSLSLTFPLAHLYLRIRRISSNLNYDYSFDGMSWVTMGSFAEGFTAIQYGLCANGNNSNTSTAIFPFFRRVSGTALGVPILGRRL